MGCQGREVRDGLQALLESLRVAIEDGLEHGFFEYEISCSLGKGEKRELIFKAGKTHRFVITRDDLERS